jgi:hypothetical protein
LPLAVQTELYDCHIETFGFSVPSAEADDAIVQGRVDIIMKLCQFRESLWRMPALADPNRKPGWRIIRIGDGHVSPLRGLRICEHHIRFVEGDNPSFSISHKLGSTGCDE